MSNATLFDFFGVEADLGRTRLSDDAVPLSYRALKRTQQKPSTETFEPYRVSAIAIDEARTHGTPLVESSILASVRAPLPSYKPMLSPSLVSKGILSAEQLENIIYAGEQHRNTFPLILSAQGEDGRYYEETQTVRYGYFIGDGTGVGKGRQSAGIILDNFNAGRTRAVWLSQSQILADDAGRDWVDLGGDKHDIVPWSRYGIEDTLDFKRGILFGTYALLRSKKSKKVVTNSVDENGEPVVATTIEYITRLKQLVDCLGATFDGVIILDECHNAGNADPTDGIKKSQQGRAVLDLQTALPFARFVYVSATGAARVDALAYAPRMGLWASNGAFKNRERFLAEMEDAGTSALEVICRDLKALGRMSSRSLSYEGIEYHRLEHDLDDDEIQLYNDYNAMWRGIEQGFKSELVALGGATIVDGKIVVKSHQSLATTTSMFQTRRQQFYSQVLLQFKMPTILAFAQKELDAGRSIIMQITHTGEAAATRAIDKMEEADSLDDLDLTQRDIMLDYVRQYYPIHRYVAVPTETNPHKVERALDHLGNEIIDRFAVERRNKLIDQIETMLVCRDGALEMIYDAFGEELVAEVTGRSKKIVLREDPITSERHRVIVPRGARENVRETEAFNNGPKRVLVFSEQAGGTGRSYHADIRFKNHQPRTHIMLEMSWRAESCVQSLGRSHRSNQVCAPKIVFPTTNVPGEKRFASTPARRIAALGALSRGDRTAAGNGLFRPEDNLETEYAHRALQALIDDMREGKIPDLDVSVLNDQLGLPYVYCVVSPQDPMGVKLDKNAVTITKFLNRLLVCDLGADGGVQGRLMDAFMERIETEVANAIAAGTYDLGVQNFRAKSIVVKKREVIHVDPLSKATTELLTIQAQKMPNTLSFESCLSKLEYFREKIGHAGSNVGFFQVGDRIELRIPSYVSIDEHGNKCVRVYGQLETDANTVPPAALKPAVAIAEADARALWNAAIDDIPGTSRKINAVVGALTPIWNHLPWVSPEIYKMTADDGERIIGRILTEPQLENTLRSLGTPASTKSVKATKAA